MKNKEVLIVFALAVLVTGLSFGYKHRAPSGCCGAWLDKNIKGFPIPFALTGPSANEGVTYLLVLHFPGLQITLVGFAVDVLLWFLVIFAIWRIVQLLKKKRV